MESGKECHQSYGKSFIFMSNVRVGCKGNGGTALRTDVFTNMKYR
jgi:hypothetical protein